MKRINLTGQIFGYWTVISYAGTEAKEWHCRCQCGTERNIRGVMLRGGRSRSCGCRAREQYVKTQAAGTSRYAKMTPTQKIQQRIYRNKWQKKQKGTYAANRLCVYHHGHTLEQKRQRLVEQNFTCANPACDFRTPVPSATLTEWCFDHDHNCCSGLKSCGRCRRGLLCHKCNRALGNVNDSPEKLEGLADYLRHHQLAV